MSNLVLTILVCAFLVPVTVGVIWMVFDFSTAADRYQTYRITKRTQNWTTTPADVEILVHVGRIRKRFTDSQLSVIRAHGKDATKAHPVVRWVLGCVNDTQSPALLTRALSAGFSGRELTDHLDGVSLINDTQVGLLLALKRQAG